MATTKDTPRNTRARRAEGSRSPASDSDRRQGTGVDALEESGADIRHELSAHVAALRYVVGTIGVCVQALNLQNADLDRDIALLLQRAVGDKVYETAERIEAIVVGVEFEGTTD